MILQDNGKQNPKESYTNKFQKHCLQLCVDDKFSKPFKTYLGKH